MPDTMYEFNFHTHPVSFSFGLVANEQQSWDVGLHHVMPVLSDCLGSTAKGEVTESAPKYC